MRPGRLDQRIAFEAEARVGDGGGGYAETWAEIGTAPRVWARVVPVSGREQVEGMRLEAPMAYRITIRNRDDLSADMRVKWRSNGDLILNIRELPDPGARAMYREIVCEAGVAT